MGSKISSENTLEGDAKMRTVPAAKDMHGVNSHPYHVFSSYNGIRSTMNSSKDNNQKKSDSQKTNQSGSNSDNVKVPTKFTWCEGGNVVYVTGNFVNWKQWFLMNRSEFDSRSFNLTLELPKGIYQFKFIVDKVWKHSQKLPLIHDEDGNVNNVISNINSTTDSEVKFNKEAAANTFSSDKKENNKEYSQRIPMRTELNYDAPSLPDHYKKKFNIKTYSRQDLIGNPKYLIKEEDFYNTIDNSYTELSRPPHVIVNLLYTNVNSDKSQCFLNIGITSSIKEKLATFIYYQPI